MKVSIFSFLLIIFTIFSGYKSFGQEEFSQDFETLKKEYNTLLQDRDNLMIQIKNQSAGESESLRREYEAIKRDRDNLMIQIKSLLQYKVQISQKEEAAKRDQQKIGMLEENKEDLLRKIRDWEVRVQALEGEKALLLEKQYELEKHIEKKEIEYKIVDELERDAKNAEADIQRLQSQNQIFEKKAKQLESDKIAIQATSDIYQRQINTLKKQYAEALQTNKNLEKRLQTVPKEFAELARKNKVLLKETALMHYNLGVFYTEQGHHRRSIAEFEKAIELNPDDAHAYFNLGYLYAEHFSNRAKAIDYFRHYLQRATKEDTEIDWVKRYILTWQTWEGQGALK